MKVTVTLDDGTRYAAELSLVTDGGGPGDGLVDVPGSKTYGERIFFRVMGDQEMRATGANLKQTNMTYPFSYYDEKADKYFFTKYIIRLDWRWYWVEDWFMRTIGAVWGKYVQPGFGFQDTNNRPTDPEVGPFKQQTLDCGLNLRERDGEPFMTNDGEYVFVKATSFYDRPDVDSISYEKTPELMCKQTIVGTSTTQPVYYIVDQKRGDLEWIQLYLPGKQLMHATREIEYFPELPFRTTMNGQEVVIEGYSFTESKVYGLIDGLWYLLEEMVISGKGSATHDRRVYVDNWMKTPPPPIKGWKWEPSLLERALLWVTTRAYPRLLGKLR